MTMRFIVVSSRFHRLARVFFGAGAPVRASYFTTPPTTVATGRPCSAIPTNGELDDIDRNAAGTLHFAAGSTTVTSPSPPADSEPPSRLNTRAGPHDRRSMSRARSITPLATSFE